MLALEVTYNVIGLVDWNKELKDWNVSRDERYGLLVVGI